MWASWFQKQIFKDFPITGKSMASNDPLNVANLDPYGHGLQDLCRGPLELLCTKETVGFMVSEDF